MSKVKYFVNYLASDVGPHKKEGDIIIISNYKKLTEEAMQDIKKQIYKMHMKERKFYKIIIRNIIKLDD